MTSKQHDMNEKVRIARLVPAEIAPDILAYIAKRVAEFKAKQKEAANG